MPKRTGNIKLCSRCRNELPLSEFYLRPSAPDGFDYLCKKCEADRSKKNPPKIRQSKKNYAIKNGKKCRRCLSLLSVDKFCINKRSLDGYSAYCKKCSRMIGKAFYANNRDSERSRRKKLYLENLDCIRKYNRDWRRKHPEVARKYARLKRKTDVGYRIRSNITRRINSVIRSGWKSAHTLELLGCDIKEFLSYIENKFLPGMTWDNYGYYGWHIDHIKPCHLFDLTSSSEQRKCFHYTNLQPLWWQDNLIKKAKYGKIHEKR